MATRTSTILFISIMLLILSGSSFGQIYKWVDEAGRTHFSSSSPQQGKADIVQPKINTYTGRRLPEPDNTNNKPEKKSKRKVTMYSAVWCGVCKTAKSYFKENGVPFEEYDIETSAKRFQDMYGG